MMSLQSKSKYLKQLVKLALTNLALHDRFLLLLSEESNKKISKHYHESYNSFKKMKRKGMNQNTSIQYCQALWVWDKQSKSK